MIEKIKLAYFKNQTIFLEYHDFIKFRATKSHFMQFLERDERRTLKQELELKQQIKQFDITSIARQNKKFQKSSTFQK